jgi:uncharacterized RDD family membrane protein YckC
MAVFETHSEGAPSARRYAGFWKRFAAYFIDFGLVAIALGALAIGAGHLAGFAGIVLAWLYFAFMESSPRQATFGKMAMGIVVTDENGGRIRFGRATGRYFGKYLSSLFLAAGFILAAFTARKQALHDMLAGTVVLDRS